MVCWVRSISHCSAIIMVSISSQSSYGVLQHITTYYNIFLTLLLGKKQFLLGHIIIVITAYCRSLLNLYMFLVTEEIAYYVVL